MESLAPEDMAIAEKAAAWIAAVESGGREERAAFATWLKESPRHVEEALFAAAVALELKGFDSERTIDVRALLTEHAGNVFPLDQSVRASSAPLGRLPQSRAVAKVWAAAAAIAVVALSVPWWIAFGPGSWQSFDTRIGEQRVVELEDGSLVHLNTRSRIAVRLRDTSRDIRLVEGEALFKVRQDSARPFRVLADDAVIQALGTQFNVYRRSKDVTVSVLEGLVRVSSTPAGGVSVRESPKPPAGHERELTGIERRSLASVHLKAGEQASVLADGKIMRRGTAEIERVASWRERRLIFEADTLTDIVTEFNRYNHSPKIRIDGETAGKARFTGVFDADDPESLVQLLESDGRLELQRIEGEIVIREP